MNNALFTKNKKNSCVEHLKGVPQKGGVEASASPYIHRCSQVFELSTFVVYFVQPYVSGRNCEITCEGDHTFVYESFTVECRFTTSSLLRAIWQVQIQGL